MAAKRILVVEDEPKQARLLKDYLEQEGYEVALLERGDLVVPKVRTEPPDAVLLDLMLPGLDGLSICREIRSFSNLPILMITARVEELDRLLGLELGADDYICKPFSPREVVARVKAVLRRSGPQPDQGPLRSGPLSLDPATHAATLGGRPLDLTPSEFSLLKVFMSRPERVFSRSELVYALQGYEFEGYERTIDSHIKNLRKKLAPAASPDKEGTGPIRTVYGVGYKFVGPD